MQVEPQGTGTDDMENNYIYHYTFGQAATGWRLDKRSYFGGYPSDQLPQPPVCRRTSTLPQPRGRPTAPPLLHPVAASATPGDSPLPHPVTACYTR